MENITSWTFTLLGRFCQQIRKTTRTHRCKKTRYNCSQTHLCQVKHTSHDHCGWKPVFPFDDYTCLAHNVNRKTAFKSLQLSRVSPVATCWQHLPRAWSCTRPLSHQTVTSLTSCPHHLQTSATSPHRWRPQHSKSTRDHKWEFFLYTILYQECQF